MPQPLNFIVIGNPISHSKSPLIHQYFAQQTQQNICYKRQFCPNDVASFQAVVEAFFSGGGTGANVTLPFKQQAFSLCHTLSHDARLAGAVNTLSLKNGQLYGDNTDGKGLFFDLQNLLQLRHLGDVHQKNILILGAGGAARGIIAPLLAGGAKITITNRTPAKAQDLVANFMANAKPNANNPNTENLHSASITDTCGHFDIVINATSAAASDTLQALPKVSAGLAYDLMYGKESLFLHHFSRQKAVVTDGLGMLVAQAAYSFTAWTGVAFSALDLPCVLKQLRPS